METELPQLIKDYEPKNIFNLDEIGLFWKLLLTKTFAFSNESRFGTKQLRNRITLAVICNVDGSERDVIMISSSADGVLGKLKPNYQLIIITSQMLGWSTQILKK